MLESTTLIIPAILFLLLLAYVAVGVYARKEMFKPTKEHADTPSRLGLPPPSEFFVESGGATLHSWFFETDHSSATVFFVHGNAGNIADRLKVIKGYLKLGLNVFIFDPRGYGKSDGRPAPKAFIQDAFSAYSHLTEKIGIDPSKIIILGQSLGGVPAVRIASEKKCAGLVLEGTFASVRLLVKDLIPFPPIWVFVTPVLDNLREIKKIAVPVLIIAGENDETIPPINSRRLYETAPEPKELLIVAGALHTDMYAKSPDVYFGAWSRFVKQTVYNRAG